jgi:hypothetical protein
MQAGFSFLAFALAFAVLRETAPRRVRFDVAGALALALGVAGFMFALGQLRERGFASPWVLGSCAVGALGLAAFAPIERRVAAPLLPLALFRTRAFAAPIVANALTSASWRCLRIAPFMLHTFSLTIPPGVHAAHLACARVAVWRRSANPRQARAAGSAAW